MLRSLEKRTDVPVKNTYSLTGEQEDLHCVLYYISDNIGELHICRLDRSRGWGRPLSLIVDNERLNIPASDSNCVKMQINTQTTLIREEFVGQLIPKVIVQTSETVSCDEDILYNSMKTFIHLNPEYEYRFFDKEDRRRFIKEFFTERILEAYDTLVPGAFQADLFRYCYLFIHGGCYFDFKMILRKPLREVIKPSDTFLVCMDYEGTNSVDRKTGTSLLNAVIMSVPKNPLLYEMIERCAENILDRQEFFLNSMSTGVSDILDLTGPTLFYKTVYNKLSPENIRFKHIIKNRDETDYKNFAIVDIDSGKLIFNKTCPVEKSTNHYSSLWVKKEVFYKNRQEVGDSVIYVYPHPYPDKFTFELEGQKLSVKREAGWGLDLKLKLVTGCGTEKNIYVGKHHCGTKILELDSKKNYPTINYVIASFAGKRPKRDKDPELTCRTLDLQLVILYKILKVKISLNVPNLVKQITLSMHTCTTEQYPGYYKFNKWKKMFEEFPDLKFAVKEYPKDPAVSYSQWINVMRDFPSYDYTIINEDDISISPTNINFDQDLVELYKHTFPEGKGYLCSRKDPFPIHASVSTGMVSTRSITDLADPLKQLHEIHVDCQIGFSLLFEANGMRVEDMTSYFKVLFYDEFHSQFKDLSKPGVFKEMFVANQYIQKRLSVDIDTFLNPF